MALIAKDLRAAHDVLEVKAISFDGSGADFWDRSYYVELPPRDDDDEGLGGLGSTDRLRQQLLEGGTATKVFLSGHIGSGKSTQVNKLSADGEIRASFAIVMQRIEAGHQAFLDANQLLFLIAGQLYEFGHQEKLLNQGGKWERALREIDLQIYGDKDAVTRQGGVALEWDLLVVKLKQDLKFSDEKRRLFRERGETLRTILVDAIKALVLDIETNLRKSGKPSSLLLLIDDLDKVAAGDAQRDIYSTHLDLFLALPLRVLFTVPSGVIFGESQAGVRQSVEHLYPLRIIDKSPQGFDPEQAFIPGSDAFFRRILDRRVDPSLFSDDAVRLAAIYSGGVLRDFFRLLREAGILARFHGLTYVDGRGVKGAVRDERRRETMGLLAADYEALLQIHQSHDLGDDQHRKYLTTGRVLECFNDKTWYEVNPILWKVLKRDR